MAAQAPAGAPFPERFIPPQYTQHFISHQRPESAQLSIRRDGTYVAIGDSYLNKERIRSGARLPFRENVEELWIDKHGIRCEQHERKEGKKNPIKRIDMPRWETIFSMPQISDIRLAEFNVDVPGKNNPQELRKAPIIEIRFKYTGRTIDRAVVPPTVDQDKDKMETDDDASKPPKADDHASDPSVADDEGEFGLPLPALHGSARPPADDDEEFGLPLPVIHGSAPPKADNDDLPMPDFGTAEKIPEFTTEDPAQFPLASSFSDMPESGLEIRLRFRKPRVSRKVTTWYWAAACGLLVGLASYLPQGTKEAIQKRRAWDLTKWVALYGNKGTLFPYADFSEVTEPQGDAIRRWRFQRSELEIARAPKPQLLHPGDEAPATAPKSTPATAPTSTPAPMPTLTPTPTPTSAPLPMRPTGLLPSLPSAWAAHSIGRGTLGYSVQHRPTMSSPVRPPGQLPVRPLGPVPNLPLEWRNSGRSTLRYTVEEGPTRKKRKTDEADKSGKGPGKGGP